MIVWPCIDVLDFPGNFRDCLRCTSSRFTYTIEHAQQGCVLAAMKIVCNSWHTGQLSCMDPTYIATQHVASLSTPIHEQIFHMQNRHSNTLSGPMIPCQLLSGFALTGMTCSIQNTNAWNHVHLSYLTLAVFWKVCSDEMQSKLQYIVKTQNKRVEGTHEQFGMQINHLP